MSGTVKQAAFITGSSRGIGLGIAKELAREGFNIALNGCDDDQQLAAAEEAIAKLGVTVVSIAGDVGDLSLHTAMLDHAEKVVGPLSTLVNNAGVGAISRGDLLEVSEQSYDRCMKVNTKAMFFLSQAFSQRLLSRSRDDDRFYSLINITSSNANAVSLNRGEYCTSKAAAAMISRLFAVRLGGEEVAVYDIQPGLIETQMTQSVKGEYLRRIEEEGITLMPRMGQPEDIGCIAARLATGGLPYTTGQVISADAGLLVSRF